MYYVYFLTNSTYSNWVYVGHTNNIRRRFIEHQEGLSKSTSPYTPLKLVSYIAVATKIKAKELEKYFKADSGKAILKKRIIADEAIRSVT